MARRNEKGLVFGRRSSRKFNMALIYNVLSWMLIAAIGVFIGFVYVYFFGIKTSMVGSSMEPVIYNGQEVLINKIAYNLSSPERFDVIVFKPNGNPNSHNYIKRVIGLPGESVQINQGKVYINGLLLENDVVDDTLDGGIAANEIKLAKDEYFVLGDNRLNSEDSRSANIGNVKTSMIEGRAWLRLKLGKIGKQRIK